MCAQRERQREREGERDWEICYWCCRCDNVWATISLHWPARTDSTKRGSRRGRGLYSNIQPCVAHTHAHVQVSSWLCMCVCSFDAPLWPINKLLLLLLLRLFFLRLPVMSEVEFFIFSSSWCFFSSWVTGWPVASWKLSIKKPIKRDVAAVWAGKGQRVRSEGGAGLDLVRAMDERLGPSMATRWASWQAHQWHQLGPWRRQRQRG